MNNSKTIIDDVLGASADEVLGAAKELSQKKGAGNAPEVQVADLEQIEKWLHGDLQRVKSLIDALLSDKDLRMQMAVWFEGRISNAKHKADPSEILKPN